MRTVAGKYEKKPVRPKGRCPWLMVPLAFFLGEVFGICYLQPENPGRLLLLGALTAAAAGGILRLLPEKGSRIAFGLTYGLTLVYAVGQTGYYQLFSEMMWLSEFRYASEGSDYLDVLLSYPGGWFLWIVALLALGVLILWKYPVFQHPWLSRGAALGVVAASVVLSGGILEALFADDRQIQFAKSDYGRMESAEAAYENMFNPRRLYDVCGLGHMLTRDVYTNYLLPLTPGHAIKQQEAEEQIETYFEEETQPQTPSSNAMTGLLKGKNVVLVLMESMDDWMIGDHTPTLCKLMEEGINFTNFYTPPYGGIRTFNTEFCINTGSFLSSRGGYAFDYVTNDYSQSLAAILGQEGYSAKVFHYNDPSFYSRDVFSQAMGYEDYICYADYLSDHTQEEQRQLLFDDLLLFKEPQLRQEFFREGKTLNFVITRSAHLSYQYREVLSHWGLKKYPEYRGMTGHEETDCALLKARLVDDFFQWLLMELEEEGRLQDTVIIGVTDHYTYGYKDEAELMKLSGVEEKLLLEKTPCFIWSADVEAMEVTKTLQTVDLLPTLLNLLGQESDYPYLGWDAFDPEYEGWALFSDGSWITDTHAYDAGTKELLQLQEGAEFSHAQFQAMSDRVQEFVKINNLILETDYYEED